MATEGLPWVAVLSRAWPCRWTPGWWPGLSGAPMPSLHPPPSRPRGSSFMRHLRGFRCCRGNQGCSRGSELREGPVLFCAAWASGRGRQQSRFWPPGR